MTRDINWRAALFAVAVLLFIPGSAMAFCVFLHNGDRLICRTCSCSALSDAGVGGPCVDVLRTAHSTTKPPFDRIVRYSDSVVKLHSPNGRESPLASDAAQKQFDELFSQPNRRELFRRFKPAAGLISVERVKQLARDLGVPVVIAHTKSRTPS